MPSALVLPARLTPRSIFPVEQNRTEQNVLMTENAQDSLTPRWVLFLALPPRPSIGPWVQGRQAARDCARVRGFLSVLSGLTRCFVPALPGWQLDTRSRRSLAVQAGTLFFSQLPVAWSVSPGGRESPGAEAVGTAWSGSPRLWQSGWEGQGVEVSFVLSPTSVVFAPVSSPPSFSSPVCLARVLSNSEPKGPRRSLVRTSQGKGPGGGERTRARGPPSRTARLRRPAKAPPGTRAERE